MEQKRQDSFEGRDSSARAAGQVENEGLAEGSAEGTAEGCVRGLGEADSAHALGDTVEEAVADGAGGVGSDIAEADSGSASGDDETRVGGGSAECVFDGFALVWY